MSDYSIDTFHFSHVDTSNIFNENTNTLVHENSKPQKRNKRNKLK